MPFHNQLHPLYSFKDSSVVLFWTKQKTQRGWEGVILPNCLRIATIEEPLCEQSNTTLIWPWKSPGHPEQGENQCPQTRRPSHRTSNEDVLHQLHQMQVDISSSQNCYFMHHDQRRQIWGQVNGRWKHMAVKPSLT